MNASKTKSTMKRLALSTLILVSFALNLSAQDYNGAWNTPTISHRNYPGKIYFGMTDAIDRRPEIDASTMPTIPGLKYRSCYAFCPKDTCYADRAIIAVRCPKDSVLLKWAAARAECLVSWCTEGQMPDSLSKDGFSAKSASDICNHYIRQVEQYYKRQECSGDGFPERPNAQRGYLLADCWKTSKYCTFYEATWYDEMSCGDNTKQSYFSVDRKTGKTASLADLVKEEAIPALAKLLVKYLKSSNGELWVDIMPEHVSQDTASLINDMDGCALIREGLVIYYHPYQIGSGADGEFMAVIPYQSIRKMLK